MSKDVITISPDENCRRALRLMHAAGIGRLPVLEGRRLVGIVTERDVYRRTPSGIAPAHVSVGGVMTYAPLTVGPSTPISEASRLLLERDLGSLPVVKGRKLLGIFTRADALRLLACQDRPVREGGNGCPVREAGNGRRSASRERRRTPS